MIRDFSIIHMEAMQKATENIDSKKTNLWVDDEEIALEV
jgi:hypothetical protein